jgi:hypothetical protein
MFGIARPLAPVLTAAAVVAGTLNAHAVTAADPAGNSGAGSGAEIDQVRQAVRASGFA